MIVIGWVLINFLWKSLNASYRYAFCVHTRLQNILLVLLELRINCFHLIVGQRGASIN